MHQAEQFNNSLLKKLASLNLDKFLIQWIADCLTQQVVVEGEASKVVKVLSGVPQGSVLGPLLFLIYIDEVGTILLSQESEQMMFADDVLLYKPISKPNDIQDDTNRIEELSASNFNPSECKCTIVCRKSQPMSPEPVLTLNGHSLSPVDR